MALSRDQRFTDSPFYIYEADVYWREHLKEEEATGGNPNHIANAQDRSIVLPYAENEAQLTELAAYVQQLIAGVPIAAPVVGDSDDKKAIFRRLVQLGFWEHDPNAQPAAAYKVGKYDGVTSVQTMLQQQKKVFLFYKTANGDTASIAMGAGGVDYQDPTGAACPAGAPPDIKAAIDGIYTLIYGASFAANFTDHQAMQLNGSKPLTNDLALWNMGNLYTTPMTALSLTTGSTTGAAVSPANALVERDKMVALLNGRTNPYDLTNGSKFRILYDSTQRKSAAVSQFNSSVTMFASLANSGTIVDNNTAGAVVIYDPADSAKLPPQYLTPKELLEVGGYATRHGDINIQHQSLSDTESFSAIAAKKADWGKAAEAYANDKTVEAIQLLRTKGGRAKTKRIQSKNRKPNTKLGVNITINIDPPQMASVFKEKLEANGFTVTVQPALQARSTMTF